MSKLQTVTENSIKKVVYSDFFTNFSVHVNTGQLLRKTNEDAVKQSVRNLLLTDFYERPMQPDVGSNLRALLFENYTPATQLRAKAYIQDVFDNYEPRAELVETIISFSEVQQALNCTIYFRIINSTEPTRLDLVIERTR